MNITMRLFVICLAIASLSADRAVTARPSERPEFSGKWTFVGPPNVTPDTPLFKEGVVTQDAATVTFTSGTRSITYRLDVPETRNTVVSARGEKMTLVSQVRWVTHALLITTKHNRGAVEGWEDLLVCSMNGPDELVVVNVAAVTPTEPVMKAVALTYRRN